MPGTDTDLRFPQVYTDTTSFIGVRKGIKNTQKELGYKEQAGAELCKAQSSALLTASNQFRLGLFGSVLEQN